MSGVHFVFSEKARQTGRICNAIAVGTSLRLGIIRLLHITQLPDETYFKVHEYRRKI
jgi:hypothetical protein